MRILIIEDNKPLSTLMRDGLMGEGFTVDTAYTGEDGEDKAFVNSYDAILLDLNLPDRDGLDILRYLRKSDISTPVIIVTARDEVEQRALGLDLGADDYLVKPFEFLELRARVQAVIRRFQGRSNPLITIGKLSINPQSRTATYDNVAIELKPKEFDILEYIASHHPTVISTEEIIEHIYDEDFDPFSSVVRVHIARLKKALANAAGTEILKTIRGKGYQLCEKTE
ncbi:MAG: response regulator transcription factor [Clostridiales Family XIII bacterium]|jgi:DNA-binding response OmpR family regulator|nr:response regulator transcription factor [Clostridiales Family XIII bacterium]